ncbi:AAA family ATPase [Actinopolymorpha pittospori]
MAGQSGMGKSTIAGHLASHTGAAILDLDIMKSTALDVGLEWDVAGRLAFELSWSLADSLLANGTSVILDSPCRFERIIEETNRIAQRRAAAYCFIECVMPDTDELRRRLRSRPRLRSQMVDVGVSSSDAPAQRTVAAQVRAGGVAVLDTKYPVSPWLQLDTRQDPRRCFDLALDYLRERRAVGVLTDE